MADFQCWLCGSHNPEWLGVRQLSNLIGVTEQEIRKRCRRGIIPDAEKVVGFNSKGHWRVPKDSAARYYQEVKGLA